MQLHWFVKSSPRPSGFGRFLRALGHSWSASPLRRVVQSLFFGLFLVLFFFVAWPGTSGNFEATRRGKEILDLEFFLALDPLVSVVAAIAARTWVWSLWFALSVLAISLLLPRVFCGYVCPLGTLIDLFDWGISNRIRRFGVARRGWWRNLRFYILAAVLVAAAGGFVLSGYVAAIPTLTRGMQFIASPIQTGTFGGWGQVAPLAWGQILSIALFAGVLLLGLLRPRFWCRHVCPSGAMFSLANLLRLTERKVGPDCIECGKCSRACSFDAINDDYSTVGANCAFCQTCGGVCPVHAISFTSRFTELSVAGAASTAAPAAPDLSRRGFVIGAALGMAGGGLASAGLRLTRTPELPPLLRPPGSAADERFVRLCVRCDQCLRVCPSGILQPSGLGQGLDRLWTPWANADRAGCEPTCNNCGQACPTGAIAALSLEDKKQTRMGLAEVDAATCLACQGRDDCQTAGGKGLICLDACEAAGYSAIVAEGEGELVPGVRSDRCVGCGMCQAACFRANITQRKLLKTAAIRVRPDTTPLASTPSPATAAAPALLVPATSQPQSIDVPYAVPED